MLGTGPGINKHSPRGTTIVILSWAYLKLFEERVEPLDEVGTTYTQRSLPWRPTCPLSGWVLAVWSSMLYTHVWTHLSW